MYGSCVIPERGKVFTGEFLCVYNDTSDQSILILIARSLIIIGCFW